MNDSDPHELEGAELWDYDSAERQEGVRELKALIAVAFTPEEFEQIAALAERLEITISQLVHDATVEKIGVQSEDLPSKRRVYL